MAFTRAVGRAASATWLSPVARLLWTRTVWWACAVAGLWGWLLLWLLLLLLATDLGSLRAASNTCL